MRNRPKGLKRKKLFNPDGIAEKLAQGLNRDFGVLFPESTPGHVKRFISEAQSKSTLKKFLGSKTKQGDLNTTTYIKFLYVNEHMKKFNKPIEPSYPRVSKLHGDVFSNVLHRAKALMHHVLTPFDEDDWFFECKNSSGSSIGVPFTDTSIEKKFAFPISATEKVTPLYDRYLTYDRHLKSAVMQHNERYPLEDRYSIVSGSRATTVAKTNSINRMICVEPTGNMFFQQGLMTLMYQRMKKVGLDVERLPKEHTRLAYESSITSRNATIDWSSASDCVSLELLRWLLPPKWFYAVNLVRSPSAIIDGTEIDLAMFSTMGNAVTFPLETLVFWTFAQAVLAEESDTNTILPIKENFSRCSVFGDDCIVPATIAPVFIDMMTRVGFIVNTDKTFIDDCGFRESCGGDYYHGINVRAFYLKAPTSNALSALEPWLYIILNSLQKKYISYFGEFKYLYNSHVFKYLFGIFQKYNIRIKLVPDYMPDDSGLKCLDDVTRLRMAFPMTFSLVHRDRHGTVSFNYCRYTYKGKQRRVDELHYAVWLKKPSLQTRDPLIHYRPKIGGGYVVAKASSPTWNLLIPH